MIRSATRSTMNTAFPTNSFKQAIRAGRPQIGLWSSLCSNVSAEVIAGAGFDWILLDTEHAPNELPMVLSQLQALVGGTAAPVVRPAWNDLVLLKRLLDAGAQNLLIPYVQTAEEARAAVEGVDGRFIGPSDLAAALGHLGQTSHPEVEAAIEDALKRIRQTGKAPG